MDSTAQALGVIRASYALELREPPEAGWRHSHPAEEQLELLSEAEARAECTRRRRDARQQRRLVREVRQAKVNS